MEQQTIRCPLPPRITSATLSSSVWRLVAIFFAAQVLMVVYWGTTRLVGGDGHNDDEYLPSPPTRSDDDRAPSNHITPNRKHESAHLAQKQQGHDADGPLVDHVAATVEVSRMPTSSSSSHPQNAGFSATTDAQQPPGCTAEDLKAYKQRLTDAYNRDLALYQHSKSIHEKSQRDGAADPQQHPAAVGLIKIPSLSDPILVGALIYDEMARIDTRGKAVAVAAAAVEKVEAELLALSSSNDNNGGKQLSLVEIQERASRDEAIIAKRRQLQTLKEQLDAVRNDVSHLAFPMGGIDGATIDGSEEWAPSVVLSSSSAETASDDQQQRGQGGEEGSIGRPQSSVGRRQQQQQPLVIDVVYTYVNPKAPSFRRHLKQRLRQKREKTRLERIDRKQNEERAAKSNNRAAASSGGKKHARYTLSMSMITSPPPTTTMAPTTTAASPTAPSPPPPTRIPPTMPPTPTRPTIIVPHINEDGMTTAKVREGVEVEGGQHASSSVAPPPPPPPLLPPLWWSDESRVADKRQLHWVRRELEGKLATRKMVSAFMETVNAAHPDIFFGASPSSVGKEGAATTDYDPTTRRLLDDALASLTDVTAAEASLAALEQREVQQAQQAIKDFYEKTPMATDAATSTPHSIFTPTTPTTTPSSPTTSATQEETIVSGHTAEEADANDADDEAINDDDDDDPIINPQRFRDFGELLYSLRTVQRNVLMGGVMGGSTHSGTNHNPPSMIRNIYIVVADKDQVPDWLRARMLDGTIVVGGNSSGAPTTSPTSSPSQSTHTSNTCDYLTAAANDTLVERIIIVEHTDMFPPSVHNSALPSFSSNVIEAYLHRIPGISRHFLYVNNDELFVRPVSFFDYFQPVVVYPPTAALTTDGEQGGVAGGNGVGGDSHQQQQVQQDPEVRWLPSIIFEGVGTADNCKGFRTHCTFRGSVKMTNDIARFHNAFGRGNFGSGSGGTRHGTSVPYMQPSHHAILFDRDVVGRLAEGDDYKPIPPKLPYHLLEKGEEGGRSAQEYEQQLSTTIGRRGGRVRKEESRRKELGAKERGGGGRRGGGGFNAIADAIHKMATDVQDNTAFGFRDEPNDVLIAFHYNQIVLLNQRADGNMDTFMNLVSDPFGAAGDAVEILRNVFGEQIVTAAVPPQAMMMIGGGDGNNHINNGDGAVDEADDSERKMIEVIKRHRRYKAEERKRRIEELAAAARGGGGGRGGSARRGGGGSSSSRLHARRGAAILPKMPIRYQIQLNDEGESFQDGYGALVDEGISSASTAAVGGGGGIYDSWGRRRSTLTSYYAMVVRTLKDKQERLPRIAKQYDPSLVAMNPEAYLAEDAAEMMNENNNNNVNGENNNYSPNDSPQQQRIGATAAASVPHLLVLRELLGILKDVSTQTTADTNNYRRRIPQQLIRVCPPDDDATATATASSNKRRAARTAHFDWKDPDSIVGVAQLPAGFVARALGEPQSHHPPQVSSVVTVPLCLNLAPIPLHPMHHQPAHGTTEANITTTAKAAATAEGRTPRPTRGGVSAEAHPRPHPATRTFIPNTADALSDVLAVLELLARGGRSSSKINLEVMATAANGGGAEAGGADDDDTTTATNDNYDSDANSQQQHNTNNNAFDEVIYQPNLKHWLYDYAQLLSSHTMPIRGSGQYYFAMVGFGAPLTSTTSSTSNENNDPQVGNGGHGTNANSNTAIMKDAERRRTAALQRARRVEPSYTRPGELLQTLQRRIGKVLWLTVNDDLSRSEPLLLTKPLAAGKVKPTSLKPTSGGGGTATPTTDNGSTVLASPTAAALLRRNSRRRLQEVDDSSAVEVVIPIAATPQQKHQHTRSIITTAPANLLLFVAFDGGDTTTNPIWGRLVRSIVEGEGRGNITQPDTTNATAISSGRSYNDTLQPNWTNAQSGNTAPPHQRRPPRVAAVKSRRGLVGKSAAARRRPPPIASSVEASLSRATAGTVIPMANLSAAVAATLQSLLQQQRQEAGGGLSFKLLEMFARHAPSAINKAIINTIPALPEGMRSSSSSSKRAAHNVGGVDDTTNVRTKTTGSGSNIDGLITSMAAIWLRLRLVALRQLLEMHREALVAAAEVVAHRIQPPTTASMPSSVVSPTALHPDDANTSTSTDRAIGSHASADNPSPSATTNPTAQTANSVTSANKKDDNHQHKTLHEAYSEELTAILRLMAPRGRAPWERRA